MNWYYHNRIHIDILYFWSNILRLSRGLVIPLICGALILRFVNANGLVRFAVWVAIYTAVYCASMWILGMNDDEKDQIGSIVKKITRRR
jgi:hypothetical protein